jgi:hypothetical protein
MFLFFLWVDATLGTFPIGVKFVGIRSDAFFPAWTFELVVAVATAGEVAVAGVVAAVDRPDEASKPDPVHAPDETGSAVLAVSAGSSTSEQLGSLQGSSPHPRGRLW